MVSSQINDLNAFHNFFVIQNNLANEKTHDELQQYRSSWRCRGP